MNPFKHDDLENHPNSNQLPLFENQIPFNTSYIEKTDEVLQTETRGVDFKGQVRYFCPRCNVRYIEFKYLKTHMKECGNVFECSKCLQKFKQKRTYTAHIKKKHGITFMENNLNIGKLKQRFALQGS